MAGAFWPERDWDYVINCRAAWVNLALLCSRLGSQEAAAAYLTRPRKTLEYLGLRDGDIGSAIEFAPRFYASAATAGDAWFPCFWMAFSPSHCGAIAAAKLARVAVWARAELFAAPQARPGIANTSSGGGALALPGAVDSLMAAQLKVLSAAFTRSDRAFACLRVVIPAVIGAEHFLVPGCKLLAATQALGREGSWLASTSF